MPCPGLVTPILAGLCALWLPSSTSSTEKKLLKAAKPHQPPQATCPTLLYHLMQAPPLLLYLHSRGYIRPCSAPCLAQGWSLPHWQGSVHRGCQAVPPCLKKHQKVAKPQPPQTTCPALLQHPIIQAQPHPVHAAEAAFDLAVSHGIPRAGHSHTGRALCTLVAEQHLLS